ncbi:hypothetical protein BH11MYX3_BH11MYX3_37140 [soil metagenome]
MADLAQIGDDRRAIADAVRERVVARYADHRVGRDALREVAAVMRSSEAGERTGHETADQIARWRSLANAIDRDAPEVHLELLGAVIDEFLADIAGGFAPGTYRAVTAVLESGLAVAFRPHGRATDGTRLEVRGALDDVRSIAATHTVMYAPTHSSNLDSILVGLALRRIGLPPCAYAAGKHMYRNRMLGMMMGRLGAYRVDRALPLDLYRDVLKEYATVLLERGFHTVVFPGATRSRTNEVDHELKLGLLGTAVTASETRPIAIVPVTISYQLVLEAESLVEAFVTGRAKERIVGRRGDWRGRLRTVRRLWNLDQRTVVDLGAPIDVRARAGTAPLVDVTRRIASDVSRAFQRGTVLFSTHVVAAAVIDHPGSEIEHAIATVIARVNAVPDRGSLHASVAANEPAVILATALAAWQSWHPSPPSAELMRFYRNRLGHLAAEVP